MAGSLMATRSRARKAKPRRRATRTPDRSLTPTGPGDKLTDAQQTAVVQRLAMYDSPQQVADWVKEEFGIDMTRQAVQYYDPTVGEKPSEKWCAIFEATRSEFLKTTADIPIANKSVRLRRLERMALAAERQRNYLLAAQLHEQAAKEVGEIYTNRHKMEHTGKDGEPIEVRTDEIRNRIVRRIAGVASRIGTHPSDPGINGSRVGGARA
jgi:hypothetical protein